MKLIFLTLLLLQLVTQSSAGLFGRSKEKKEKEEAALHEIQLGMAGLERVASDPALLAQLQRDMMDPEMMEAAQKMMNSKVNDRFCPNSRPHNRNSISTIQFTNYSPHHPPTHPQEFKKQMKSLEKSKHFKDALELTQNALEDPQTSARLEAQMEKMTRDGNKVLDNMEETVKTAMDQMGKNPAMMRELKNLMSNPEQLREMMDDPSVRAYMDQMGDIMKDPAAAAQMEALKKQFSAGGL